MRRKKAEAEFSARLFLTLAQENDQVTDHLEHDLNRFKALEKNFLNTLTDDDEDGVQPPDPRCRDLAGRSGGQADRTTDACLGHPG
jgi:hypothetical protein